MRFKTILVSALLLMSIPQPARAEGKLADQPEVADAIKVFDMWIVQHIAHRGVPGLSIAVVFDKEIVWSKGYGYSDLEERATATPSTVYRIGSITKLFTSTAIMQLRDQGKLRLDDPVSLYLPWFSVPNPIPDAPKITIRQLLTHTAGLSREANFPYWTDHIFPTREELAESLPDQDAINADNGSPYTVARQAYSVFAKPIVQATKNPASPKPPTDPAWQQYVGLYEDPWGWEYEVLILGGELVMYGYDYPPWEDASTGYTRLTPVDGATFRRPSNELVTFELDEEGDVIRIKRNNNYVFPKEKEKIE